MNIVSQFSDYFDDSLTVETPVRVSLGELSSPIRLFDVVRGDDHEVMVYVGDDALPIKPSDEVDNSAVKQGSSRGRVSLPPEKFDAVGDFSNVTLRVVWKPLNATQTGELSLDVVLSIEVAFNEDAIEGGDFVAPDEAPRLSVRSSESWQAAGEIQVRWHPRMQQFFGQSDAFDLELALQKNGYEDVLDFRILTEDGSDLSGPFSLEQWRSAFPNDRIRVQARLLKAAPEALVQAGKAAFQFLLSGHFGSQDFELADLHCEFDLRVDDATDVIDVWFESLVGQETDREQVALNDRRLLQCCPSIQAPDYDAAPAHLYIFRWTSTVTAPQIDATISPGLAFIDSVERQSQQIEINQGAGWVAVIALPDWDREGGEITLTSRELGSIAKIAPQIEFTALTAPAPVLAVDIGTSSLCVAFGQSGQGVDFVRLASHLKKHDPDHLEAGVCVGNKVPDALVSSVVGVFPDGESELKHWRKSELPMSTWWCDSKSDAAGSGAEAGTGAASAGEGTADGGSGEDGLQVSVPFAMARNLLWGTGDGSLIAQNLKMQALRRQTTALLTTLGERTHGPIPTVQIVDLYRSIFRELAAFHLPWSGSFPEMLGGTLILSHPNQLSKSDFSWMKEAAEPLRIALGVDPKNVFLVTEGRAALQYAAIEYRGAIRRSFDTRSGNPARLLVFDLGAGTLDITMGEMKFDGPPEDMVRELASIGASVGGNTIDLILYFMLHDRLTDLAQRGTISYACPLIVNDRSALEEGHDARETRLAVRLAIDLAKKQLHDAIVNHDPAGDQGAPCLDIGIEIRPGHRALAQINIPQQNEIYEDTSPVGPGKRRMKFLRIPFTLEDIAAYPPMQELVGFMVQKVPQLLTNQVKKSPDFVVLTGRASLWRPLRDAISAAVELPESPLHNAKWLDQDSSVDHLKSAVVEGAINIALNTYVDASQRSKDKEPPFGGQAFGTFRRTRSGLEFAPENSGVGPQPVGNHDSEVTYPPGLEKFEIDRPDWRLSLLLQTRRSLTSLKGGRTRRGLGHLSSPKQEPISEPTREIDPTGQAMTYDDAPPGYMPR